MFFRWEMKNGGETEKRYTTLRDVVDPLAAASLEANAVKAEYEAFLNRNMATPSWRICGIIAITIGGCVAALSTISGIKFFTIWFISSMLAYVLVAGAMSWFTFHVIRPYGGAR
jgi:hypothetical protein